MFKLEIVFKTTDEESGAIAETTHTETLVSQRSVIEEQEAMLAVLTARKDAQKAKLVTE